MAEDTGKSLYNKKGKLKRNYYERPPITSQKWVPARYGINPADDKRT